MNNIKNKVSDIASALNLSTRRIQQLVKDGVLPTPIRGKYDLANCIRAYGQYFQEQQLTKTLILTKGSGLNELTAEKLRLLKTQAEKAELELEVLKDKYMEVSEVEFTWKGLMITFRSKMLSLPTKLVRSLAEAGGDFAKIEKILEDEIHDALLELSNYRGEEEFEEEAECTST